MTPSPTGPHTIEQFLRGYEGERTLRGFRRPACGIRTATWGLACSRCGHHPLEETTLSDRGTIVVGTIVAVAADEFVNDAPYAYVLVELDGGGKISGWMPRVGSERAISPGTRVRFAPSYKPGVQFAKDAPGPGTP